MEKFNSDEAIKVTNLDGESIGCQARIEVIKAKVIQALHESLEAVGAIVNAVSDVVTREMSRVVEVNGAIQNASDELTRGVIEAVYETSTNLGMAAKGIAIGVVRGDKLVGRAAFEAIAFTAGAIVRHTTELLGDVETAAEGAVRGAIEGAQSIGLNPEEAASAAAEGAIAAANVMSVEIGLKIQKATVKTFDGVKVIRGRY